MKIIDLKLNVDGLILADGETVESFVAQVEKLVNSVYPVKYDVLYEEEYVKQ